MPKELCACRQDFGKDKQMVITIKTCYKKHPGKEDLVSVSFRELPNKNETETNKEKEKKERKEVTEPQVIKTRPEPSPTDETETNKESEKKEVTQTKITETPPKPSPTDRTGTNKEEEKKEKTPPKPSPTDKTGTNEEEEKKEKTPPKLSPTDIMGTNKEQEKKEHKEVTQPKGKKTLPEPSPTDDSNNKPNQPTTLPEIPLVQTQSELVQTETTNSASLGDSVQLAQIDYEAIPDQTEPKPKKAPSDVPPGRSWSSHVKFSRQVVKSIQKYKQNDSKPELKSIISKLAPIVTGREELRPVPDRKDEYHEDLLQPVPNLKEQSGPSITKQEEPKDLTRLPEIPNRYHGPGCALEVNLLEKHADYCNYRKGPNEARDPVDDRSGSYETLGRMTFRTCAPQTEPMVVFYSFVDRLRESLDDDGTLQLDEDELDLEWSILEELRENMWDPLTNNAKRFDMGKGGLNTKCEDCESRCSCKDDCSCKAIEELYVRRSSRDEATQTRTVIVKARRGWGWRRLLFPCVFQD